MSDEPTVSQPRAPSPPPEDDGGIVGRFGLWLVGRSYKTTIAGYAGFVGTVVYGFLTLPGADLHDPKTWAPLIPMAATSLGLTVAKDGNVSGKSRG